MGPIRANCRALKYCLTDRAEVEAERRALGYLTRVSVKFGDMGVVVSEPDSLVIAPKLR